jgi:transaldolase
VIYILDFSGFIVEKKVYGIYSIPNMTNNSIIKLDNINKFINILKEIRSKIGLEQMFYIQIFHKNSTEIVDLTKLLKKSLEGSLYIKTNDSLEGIKAKKQLAKEDINIFTSMISLDKNLFNTEYKEYVIVKPVNIVENQDIFMTTVKKFGVTDLLNDNSKNFISDWEKIYNKKK